MSLTHREQLQFMGEGAASPPFIGPMMKGQFTEDADGILAALLAWLSSLGWWQGNPNDECAKRIDGKRKLALVLIHKSLGKDKGNSQFTLWPTYSCIKGVLSVPGKRTDACINTCCLCFIFRLFHHRKESRASWTSGVRPHLVFSGFPAHKGPK